MSDGSSLNLLKTNLCVEHISASQTPDVDTLDSEIDKGPKFIDSGFFSRPYCLIKEGEGTFLCNM
jgi:hypothetical protein